MSIRWIRWSVIFFFLLFVAAVTWPGMTLGNRIHPLILGLPFSMVWIASWVVLSFLVLVALDSAEGRAGNLEDGRAPDPVASTEPLPRENGLGLHVTGGEG